MPEKITIDFSNPEPKKHSLRWDADDKDAVLSTVYIRKGTELDRARRIRVTVEAVEA